MTIGSSLTSYGPLNPYRQSVLSPTDPISPVDPIEPDLYIPTSTYQPADPVRLFGYVKKALRASIANR